MRVTITFGRNAQEKGRDHECDHALFFRSQNEAVS